MGGGPTDIIGGHDIPQNLFSKLSSKQHLFATWQKFTRGKHGKRDVQEFERDLEKNIFKLHEDLLAGQYQHGSYESFIVHDPKRRQIHKASVRDRLLHQAVTDIIEPFFEKRFIFDSFSCRKGKGTHAGVKRLQKFLRQASHNNTQTVYVLKCDIKQFFASVDHQILLELIEQQINDKQLLVIIKKIIDSFYVTAGQGIPLGNVTSQLFANIYLHELDWFAKRNLREKYYLRYCDDFVAVSTDRKHLLELVETTGYFLDERLKLNLHPDKLVICNWNQGVDFLGYILKPHCTVLRTKTKKRMLKRINQHNLSSYLGLCSHADSHRLQQTIINVLAD